MWGRRNLIFHRFCFCNVLAQKTMMLRAFGPNAMCLVVALLAAVGGGEAAFSEISCYKNYKSVSVVNFDV
jgi:hypothetical protein